MFVSYKQHCAASLSLLHFGAVKFRQVSAVLQAIKTLGSIVGVAIFFLSFFKMNSRSLNELRVLLLESHRHSRDMEKDLNREVRKAEWKVKEQKLQDDIKTLRDKLLLLVRTQFIVISFETFLVLFPFQKT